MPLLVRFGSAVAAALSVSYVKSILTQRDSRSGTFQTSGAIRCVYSFDMEEAARKILDKQVRVQGQYETLANRKPRLVEVSSMDILDQEAT